MRLNANCLLLLSVGLPAGGPAHAADDKPDSLQAKFGPRFVVGEEFAVLDSAAVAIYGSWAARYEGIAGPPPNDVDVLVIGDVPRRDLYEAAERAEQRLGLPVNPVLCSRQRWLAAADPLIRQVRSAPLVWLTGEEPREGDG